MFFLYFIFIANCQNRKIFGGFIAAKLTKSFKYCKIIPLKNLLFKESQRKYWSFNILAFFHCRKTLYITKGEWKYPKRINFCVNLFLRVSPSAHFDVILFLLLVDIKDKCIGLFWEYNKLFKTFDTVTFKC